MKTERRVTVRRAEDRALRDILESGRAKHEARKEGKREGDGRAWTQRYPLTFFPNWHEPMRWLPKHGEPLCVGEWVSQAIYRNRLLLYIAVVATMTLYVAVAGVPAWVPFLETT